MLQAAVIGIAGVLLALQIKQTKPEFAVYESIRRMMPKGPLGRQMLKKVRIYAGPTHNNAAQKPEPLTLK